MGVAGQTANRFGDYLPTQRIAVLYADGTPAMPTKVYRAKKLIASKKAKYVKNIFGFPAIQLKYDPPTKNQQKVFLGVDPGKNYTGIGIQTKRNTVLALHVKLPCKNKKNKLHGFEDRGIFRQNRNFEIRLIKNLMKYFPIVGFSLEISRSRKKMELWNDILKNEYWYKEQLEKILPVKTVDGVVTSKIRDFFNLVKQKKSKGENKPETQAIDGIALAAANFSQGRKKKTTYHCKITTFIFIAVSQKVSGKRENTSLNTNINKRAKCRLKGKEEDKNGLKLVQEISTT